MDFPEPISGMLRQYNWDDYIQSQRPIPVNSVIKTTHPYLVVKKTTHPYLVVKKTSNCIGSMCRPDTSIKVIGFIHSIYNHSNKIFPNTFVGDNLQFNLSFFIHETGELSRDKPETTFVGSNIYELPPEIHEEMLLANSFAWHLDNLLKFGVLTQEKYDMLETAIDRLIELEKPDYLKISLFHGHITPLMTLASGLQQQNALNNMLKRIIKFYTLEEIKFADRYGNTALDKANSSNKTKMIKDAIEINSGLTGFIAASDKYYKNKKTPNPIPIWDIADIREYMGGKTKRKRRAKKRTNKRRR